MAGEKLGLKKIQLVLVTDNRENNKEGQPTRFHVARRRFFSEGVSATACGRKNFRGLAWDFYNWIYTNTDVMCEVCVTEVQGEGGVVDVDAGNCPF